MTKTPPYLLILFCLFLFSEIKAQTPGYLGRHIGLGFQESFFLIPIRMYEESVLPITPTNKHAVFLDLTLGRKVNIDLHYSLFMNKMRMGTGYYDGPASISGTQIRFTPTIREHRVAIQFFDIGFSFFLKKKFIAPLGPYHQLRIGFLTGELKGGNQLEGTAEYMDSYGNFVTNAPATIYGKEQYVGNRIGYLYGNRKILSDFLYIKYSIAAYYFIGDPFEWIIGGNDNYRDYIGSSIGGFTRWCNTVEINVGVGWLLL